MLGSRTWTHLSEERVLLALAEEEPDDREAPVARLMHQVQLHGLVLAAQRVLAYYIHNIETREKELLASEDAP